MWPDVARFRLIQPDLDCLGSCLGRLGCLDCLACLACLAGSAAWTAQKSTSKSQHTVGEPYGKAFFNQLLLGYIGLMKNRQKACEKHIFRQ